MAQVTFRGSRSAAGPSFGLPALLANPTGTQVGDFMLFAVGAPLGNNVLPAVYPTPSGWTFLRNQWQPANGGYSISLFYRFATGSDPAPEVQTNYFGAVVAYGAVHRTAPVEAAAGSNFTNIANWPAPSVTTAYPRSVVLSIYGSGNGQSILVSGSHVDRTNNGFPLLIADAPQTLPGPTPLRDAYRPTGPASTAVSLTIALREAQVPPDAPILYTSGSLNRAAPNVIDWEHVDENGDGQSAARIFDRVGTGPWTQIDVVGPNSAYEAPALSLALGQHEYQVQTADTDGAWGARSTSGFFLVANPPAGPAITAPVNGSTIGTPQVSATWTGNGTSWELRTVAEVAGVADPSQVYYESGEQQVSAVGRQWDVPLPVNSRRERLQVREKASGLFGDWSDVGYLVSYTLPGLVPGSVVPGATALLVTAGPPVLTGGEPAVAYLELERGLVLTDGSIASQGFLRALDKPGRVRLQVGPRGTHPDGTASSGVDYAYRWHAIGQNQTRSAGPWFTGPADFGLPGGGSNAYDAATFGAATLG